MFDEHALELEWAEPIVGALEHVVRAADEGQVTLAVSVATSPV
jgi:hypothetical protein